MKLDAHLRQFPNIYENRGMPTNICEFFPAICEKLQIENFENDLNKWDHLESLLANTSGEAKIGIVGKYTALKDAYLSVIESIKIASYHANKKPVIEWIESEELFEVDLGIY